MSNESINQNHNIIHSEFRRVTDCKDNSICLNRESQAEDWVAVGVTFYHINMFVHPLWVRFHLHPLTSFTVRPFQSSSILVMPTTPPAIKESTKEGLITYALGDVINVNCTSPLSKPATRLNWRINDKPVRQLATTNWTHKCYYYNYFTINTVMCCHA